MTIDASPKSGYRKINASHEAERIEKGITSSQQGLIADFEQWMKKILLVVSIICSLASCSKSGGGTKPPGEDDLNREVVLRSVGSFSKSAISAESYPGSLYPMQVFDKNQISENGSFNEFQVKTSPYSLIFNFYPSPYIEKVSDSEGFLSFTKVSANAMGSEEWEIFQDSDITGKSLLMACGTYSSTDKAKAFLGEPSLYRLVDECSGKYVFITKLITSKFDILTNFDGKLTSEELDNLCYVSSVTIGRSAYLVLSANENPDNLMDIFCKGILKGDMAYLDDYLRLSSISVITRGCGGSGGYWGESGYKTLIDTFDPNTVYAGVPVSFELQDAATNETVLFGTGF